MTVPLLFVVGPTASGKTSLAVPLAQAIAGEIVSVDSMQIYRGMDVGTAKPGPDLRRLVTHHLLDICDPWVEYNTRLFVEDAGKKIEEIAARGRQALLVGGTALYVKSLLEGIFDGPSANWEVRRELEARDPKDLYLELCRVDAAAARRISPNDLRRVIRALEVFYSSGVPISEHQERHTVPRAQYRPCFIGLNWQRPALRRRIERRVAQMLDDGLIEETKRLLGLPYPLSRTAAKAIGYRETIEALADPAKIPGLRAAIEQNTRRYAKRQMTWLRRFPVHWLDVEEDTPLPELLDQSLEYWQAQRDAL